MDMKLILMAALLGIAGVAQAGSDYFAPNLDCTGTACTAYTNDNPNITVSFVSHDSYWKTISVTVNGVSYTGLNTYAVVATLHNVYGNHEYIWHYDNVVMTAANGSTVLLSMDVDYRSILIRSGHNYYRTTWTVLSGTVVTA